MVRKTEIEAAETLADLAELAMRRTRSESRERKRGRKPVKTESPPSDWVKKCQDLTGGREITNRQKCKQQYMSESMELKKDKLDPCHSQVKVEQDALFPKTATVCPTNNSLVGCRKSKRNLTEEEREARRIRRVLANRESARQTIRRRQALCEELTRKAADLSLENENLKRKKELALEEFKSLETRNKNLKDRIANLVKTEVAKVPVENKLDGAEISTSTPRHCPMLMYSHHPVTPVFWPYRIQSPNPIQLQHGPQSSLFFPCNTPVPHPCMPNSYHVQNDHMNTSKTQNPFCIAPCPCFFPFPNFGNSAHSNTVSPEDNYLTTQPITLKTEASGSTETIPINDPTEHAVRFHINVSEQRSGSYGKSIFHRPASVNCISESSTGKRVNGFPPHCPENVEVLSTTSPDADSLEKQQDRDGKPCKNLANAVAAAAAEARKRRKELTKLKSIHARQCRMKC